MHTKGSKKQKNELIKNLLECKTLNKTMIQNIEHGIADSNFICSNEEWKLIAFKLIGLIKTKTESKPSKLKLESFEIADIWEANKLFEEPVCNDTVPFDIGLKLLHNEISFKDIPSLNLHPKVTNAISEIEKAAKIDFDANITKHTEERFKVLENRKNYWKTLAQKRLIELRKEFEFRNQIVFNHP